MLFAAAAAAAAVPGGAAAGEASGGGDAASFPLGTKDSKGEHVLVTLLERMKSLEGETATLRAA